MYMRIRETGEHHATLAGNRLDALGDAQMLPDPRDHSMTDHNRNVLPQRRLWCGVDRDVRNRQILCTTNHAQTEQAQSKDDSSDTPASDH
jgi:hypothetical protein